ncbi:MFS transporter [Terricaulis sp.]|uniref:MFS transporter n=1 Tax=Terricaulis sp. TaxID=2768686 RepID=UPI002AC49FB1|nr:MFS transporter [Terricaulis sp.]MDZ4691826.1 MFS transporter [Terricaulis sp.]
MTDAARAPGRTWRAPPDSLIASVMLAFLATAGLFYVNIMAAIVTGLIDALGVSEQEAGFVASANMYGAAVGALCAVALVRFVPWRPFALGALVLIIGIDVASTFLRDLQTLIAVRAVHGFIGGALVGVSYGIFSRTKSPDRVFGMLLVVQFGLGGLGTMLLPRLVPVFGTAALFYALAAFSLAALLMLPFLSDYPLEDRQQKDRNRPRIQFGPLGATLAAVFLFQLANMALAAYVIELGRRNGLTTDFASAAVGASSWVSIIGAVLVVALGVRMGRWRPLLIGMALAVVGTFAFHWSADPIAYIAANCITGSAWAFIIAYLLGMAAEFDRSGRTAAAAGFISKMGLASGPFIAGVLLETTNYDVLINAATLALALSALAMLWPALLSDRRLKESAQ